MSENLKNQIIWDDFRKGSKDALEAIYEDNYSSLYYYGLKYTKDNELVKDLIQELFIELIDSGSRLATTDNVRFYLLKALRNKLTRHLSKKSMISNDNVESFDFNVLDSIESQLIKEEIEEDIKNRIMSAVRKLSAKQQEIIYLRFYSEISYQEIANLFDVEIQTVRNLMSRAIKSLKDDFQNNNISKSMIFFLLSLRI